MDSSSPGVPYYQGRKSRPGGRTNYGTPHQLPGTVGYPGPPTPGSASVGAPTSGGGGGGGAAQQNMSAPGSQGSGMMNQGPVVGPHAQPGQVQSNFQPARPILQLPMPPSHGSVISGPQGVAHHTAQGQRPIAHSPPPPTGSGKVVHPPPPQAGGSKLLPKFDQRPDGMRTAYSGGQVAQATSEPVAQQAQYSERDAKDAGQSWQQHPQQQQQVYPAARTSPQVSPTQPAQQGATTSSRPSAQRGAPAPKRRIDPARVPNPLYLLSDQRLHLFETDAEETPVPPAPVQRFRAVDNGNASPRLMRLSIFGVPETKNMLSGIDIPLGAVVQPLAPPKFGEEPVPVVDTGPTGPIKCARCRAIMNPFVQFAAGGAAWECNICRMMNDVPSDYYCSLDVNGQRRDKSQRPELSRGAVEYILHDPSFLKRNPPPPRCILFVVEASESAMVSGFTQACLDSIERSLLDVLEKDPKDPLHVGLVTFNSELHFFSFNPSFSMPRILVMPELEEAFAPLPTDSELVLPLIDIQETIFPFLKNLPSILKEMTTQHCALGAALQAAYRVLEPTGGRVISFATSMCNFGPGALKARDEPKIYGAKEEAKLYLPASIHYTDLGKKCATSQVGIDLMLCGTQQLDVASLTPVCELSGGQLTYIPTFDSAGVRYLENRVRHTLAMKSGAEATCRIRSSVGIGTAGFVGHCLPVGSDGADIAVVDESTTLSCYFDYDEKLEDRDFVFFQFVMLYSAPDRTRRLRALNLRVPVIREYVWAFKRIDSASLIRLHLSSLLKQLGKETPDNLRGSIGSFLVNTLSMYRQEVSSNFNTAQLVIPLTLKHVPTFLSSAVRQPVFRSSRSTAVGSLPVSADMRMASKFRLEACDLEQLFRMLYPRLMCLSEMTDIDIGMPWMASDRVVLPSPMRLNSDLVNTSNGAFLIDTCDGVTVVYVGSGTSSKFLMDVFGVANFESLKGGELKVTESEQAKKVLAVIATVEKDLDPKGPVILIKEGDRQQLRALRYMYEDATTEDDSYVDYLAKMHLKVLERIEI